MSTQHDRFLERLQASSGAVFVLGHWFHGQGWDVSVPGMRLAPTQAEADEYSDKGKADMTISRDGSTPIKLQVKHRVDIEFTGAADWPHPDGVFVGRVAAVDGTPDVAAHVTLSASMRHAIVVPASSRPHWTVVERIAKNNGFMTRLYVCPLRHVGFRELV